ncbi:MAG: selenosugar synthase SenB [Planctomycetota bacterium]|nr:selenosugar synthase SenB [Planctomycetota bacterium]
MSGSANTRKRAPIMVTIVTPTRGDVATGNRMTALAWADRLTELGHEVDVTPSYRGQPADMLVALHGVHSHDAIAAFKRAFPDRPAVLILTGTDVYPRVHERTLASMRRSDRSVALQPGICDRIPAELRDRVRVIVQSSSAPARPARERSRDSFDVCVVGHLRAIKDPLRAAEAARLLPDTSRIRIRHAGAILEPEYREYVEREQKENPRYMWLGELAPPLALELIVDCQLQVLSSHTEGGGRVIGESAVAGTPLLAPRNDASRTLLGEDYAGLFTAGDTRELADLMSRAETDAAFLESLRARVVERAARFDPKLEREAVRDLVDELAARRSLST